MWWRSAPGWARSHGALRPGRVGYSPSKLTLPSCPVWKTSSGASDVKLFRGDVLNHSLVKLVEEFIPGGQHYKLVANLPYYITTPVLFHFLESPLFFERLVVMLQLEVGERLAAPVDSSATVSSHLLASSTPTSISCTACRRRALSPVPTVDSCIVRFRRRRKPKFDGRFALRHEAHSRGLLPAAQDLAQSAEQQLWRPQGDHTESLEAAGIDEGRRPQTLSLGRIQEVGAGDSDPAIIELAGKQGKYQRRSTRMPPKKSRTTSSQRAVDEQIVASLSSGVLAVDSDARVLLNDAAAGIPWRAPGMSVPGAPIQALDSARFFLDSFSELERGGPPIQRREMKPRRAAFTVFSA